MEDIHLLDAILNLTLNVTWWSHPLPLVLLKSPLVLLKMGMVKVILFLNRKPSEEFLLFAVLKLTHLDMYRRRLSERARRRRIARDYHLVERFFNPQASKKEKEVKEKLPMTVSNLKKKLQAEYKWDGYSSMKWHWRLPFVWNCMIRWDWYSISFWKGHWRKDWTYGSIYGIWRTWTAGSKSH